MTRSVPRRPASPLAGLAALAIALVACSSGVSTTPSPSGAQPPADCARVDAEGVITLSVDNLEFSAPCMVATAGEAFTIRFTNNEEMPHNVAAYRDSTKANEIYRGEIITGPDQSLDYPIEALDAGTYYFDCTVHPGDMNGALFVVAAGS
ncbi:MAG TPA: plastocyanin/azurin family copper-binding protein [Candidatus Limnocylindria bacterium]